MQDDIVGTRWRGGVAKSVETLDHWFWLQALLLWVLFYYQGYIKGEKVHQGQGPVYFSKFFLQATAAYIKVYISKMQCVFWSFSTLV